VELNLTAVSIIRPFIRLNSAK